MARRPRSASLETRAGRLRLPVQRKPHAFTTIAPGIALAYRRNQGAGRWVVRCADGRGGAWTKAFGIADDYEESDAERVLTFWEAQDKARALARGKDEDSGRPGTVAEAIDDYEADLVVRGGAVVNAQRLRRLLPPAILSKPIALLSTKELRRFRDGLAASMKRASVNRVLKPLKAALTLAADHDPERIGNRQAWRIGLAALKDFANPNNIVLSDDGSLLGRRQLRGRRGARAAGRGAGRDRGSHQSSRAVAGRRRAEQQPRLAGDAVRQERPRREKDQPSPGADSCRAGGPAADGGGRAWRGRGAAAAKRRQVLGAGQGRPSPALHGRGRQGRPRSEGRHVLRATALPHHAIVAARRADPRRRGAARLVRANGRGDLSKHIASHGDELARAVMLDLDPPAGNVVPLPGRRA